ncbi:MAG: response regulator [Anditalea sp.]
MKISDILVIDDDILTNRCIQRMIFMTEFKNVVSTFKNGKEALAHLDDKAKYLDQVLIFLDINMPVLDGWGFLDELQNRGFQNKINVLIMSSSTALSDKKKSKQYPQVMGYLEKPLETDTLLDIIDLFKTNIIIPNFAMKSGS